jgi:hypothetical protein
MDMLLIGIVALALGFVAGIFARRQAVRDVQQTVGLVLEEALTFAQAVYKTPLPPQGRQNDKPQQNHNPEKK